MKRVRYSTLARQDLLDIWVYIASHDPLAADRVYDRIEASCSRLRLYPHLGPARPEIAADARALVIERWIALYRVTEDGVQVVRIADTARNLAGLEWSLHEPDV